MNCNINAPFHQCRVIFFWQLTHMIRSAGGMTYACVPIHLPTLTREELHECKRGLAKEVSHWMNKHTDSLLCGSFGWVPLSCEQRVVEPTVGMGNECTNRLHPPPFAEAKHQTPLRFGVCVCVCLVALIFFV
jgi:hypothetical protein